MTYGLAIYIYISQPDCDIHVAHSRSCAPGVTVYYSTDQMQGIRRTRFDRILKAFSPADERIYR